MRLVQYKMPGQGRRVGLVEQDALLDLTELDPQWDRVCRIFQEARQENKTIEEYITGSLDRRRVSTRPYGDLWTAQPGDSGGWLLPPIDHPDPAHCIVGGTGLTHLGSTAQRDQMHKGADSALLCADSALSCADSALRCADVPQTDSQKMFQMGLRPGNEGGKPEPGVRGVAPECFYKGSGVIVRGHNGFLDIPSFAEDGGEEPEIVGCYIIGDDGLPYRLGFAIGNEWSDHTMERVNYLWLAPSKLRTCAIGPELVTDQPFQDIRGWCRISRAGETFYDSGELLTGEEHMSHSLANLEDHHFKHPQFRVPGDVLLYFFGTSKFSFGERGPLQEGDRIEIQFSGMGAPLVNTVRRIPPDATPVVARKG